MDLIFDSSVLSCFARAGLLDLLDRLTAHHRRLVPRAVVDELDGGKHLYPQLADVSGAAWLERVPVDSLAELRAFARYTARFGAERDFGEASVLAYAEVHNAVALIDDQIAVQVGRERNVDVRRSLALLIGGVRRNILTEAEAGAAIDKLIAGGARFPCTGADFVEWARREGMFD